MKCPCCKAETNGIKCKKCHAALPKPVKITKNKEEKSNV